MKMTKETNYLEFYTLLQYLTNNGFEEICSMTMFDECTPLKFRKTVEGVTTVVTISENSISIDSNTEGVCCLTPKEAMNYLLDRNINLVEKFFESIFLEESDKGYIIKDKKTDTEIGYVRIDENGYSIIKFKRTTEYYTCVKTFQCEYKDIKKYLEEIDKANIHFNEQSKMETKCESKSDSSNTIPPKDIIDAYLKVFGLK